MFSDIPEIYLAGIAIIIGFIGLVWSADRFVTGAASLAKSFGVSALIIGLTIVSFGTSAPEIMVSINASIVQAGDLAIGNALGSNIANIALVLAVTLLIAQIPIQHHLLKHELPILLFVSILGGIFLFDGVLSKPEGWILLLMLPVVLLLLIKLKKQSLSPVELDQEQEDIAELSRTKAIVLFIVGLVLLMVSSKILVWGAETTAVHFHVSPLIIGLTVIAIGTSLPELAASITSAIKGHHDIALGNIIGSNMFNLLAVMSLPGIIFPPEMGPEVFKRDFVAMMAVTLLLGAVIFYKLRANNKAPALGRATGVLLLACYIGYYVYLFSNS